MKAPALKMETEKKIFKYSESKSTTFIGLAFSHVDSRFIEIGYVLGFYSA